MNDVTKYTSFLQNLMDSCIIKDEWDIKVNPWNINVAPDADKNSEQERTWSGKYARAVYPEVWGQVRQSWPGHLYYGWHPPPVLTGGPLFKANVRWRGVSLPLCPPRLLSSAWPLTLSKTSKLYKCVAILWFLPLQWFFLSICGYYPVCSTSPWLPWVGLAPSPTSGV